MGGTVSFQAFGGIDKMNLKRRVLVMASAILALSIILSIFSVLPYSIGYDVSNQQTAPDDTIRLVAPPFVHIVSAAEPLAAGDAFPQSEAGFCSWILVSDPIDLEKAVTVYSQIEDLGMDHARGIIPIANLRITEGVHVYVDTDGYIIAYFDYTDPASRAIKWEGQNFGAPVVAFLTDRAIEEMCTALGISYGAYEDQLLRFDFNYPSATTMMVFENTNAGGTDDYVTFLFPESHTLYEASYSLAVKDIVQYHNDHVILYHDGVQVRDCVETVCSSKYDLSMYLTKGESHTLRTWMDYTSGSANVFLYSV